METDTADLLTGAVDLHVHGAPDVIPRRHTDLQLATRARDAGMRAIVLKSHHESTVGRATDVCEASGMLVFGGIVLNAFVSGGIYPDVVESALDLGARVVWLPTLGSSAHADAFGRGQAGWREPSRPPAIVPAHLPVQRLSVAGSSGRRLRRICELIAQADAILATGHLGADELGPVANLATKAGARLLFTHPDYRVPALSLPTQRALAREFPNAFFERCAYPSSADVIPRVPLERVARAIAITGAHRNVISSDLGQPRNRPYPEGLREFAQSLIGQGVPRAEVLAMMSTTPAGLLGLRSSV